MNTEETAIDLQVPSRLTYEKVSEDLASIPINQSDVLFEEFSGDSSEANEVEADSASAQLYNRLEKFILFKTNLELESQQIKSDFSLGSLNSEFEALENRLGSLQHFIDISKKFFSISRK